MASELRVDKIIPVDGVPTGGGGGIVQIKHTTKTDPWTHSGTYTTYEQVTGLNVTITPMSTDSKILITASVNYSTAYWQGYGALYKQLTGGSYAIVDGAIGGANGSQPRYSFSGLQYSGVSGQAMNQYHGSITYLDSPNTTNPVSYSIALRGYSNSYAVYCNRNYDDSRTGNDYFGRGASFITAMEVSA